MTGINTIACEMKARCPYCGRGLRLTQLPRELFRRMLERLKRGEQISAGGFGNFRLVHMPAKTLRVSQDVVQEMPPYKLLRFKAYQSARDFINDRIPTTNTRETAWRKKKPKS